MKEEKPQTEKLVGKITHYFDKIGVGVIELTDATLKAGDTIRIKGHEREFDQVVASMQVDHQEVEAAKKGESVGLKVDNPVKEGNEVFKVAVQKMLESAVKTCERAQIKPEELKLFIPHQANLRIINAVAKRLRLREEQVFINLDRIGNISAATIPVALAEADEKGLLRSGDLLAMVAFGGGFTWAGMSLRW